ncbi:MAG: hypothetical protein KGP14_06875 [Betaproteobacteria bacterium]|nr:hypothetical protein [Betaproteobacteria bacterium]
MTFPANVLTIQLQKQILTMVDAGNTYEQIREALHVNSTVIARVKRRRQVFRDGLVDTEFEGQPMNAKGGTYIPTPAEIAERAAIVRMRQPISREEEQRVEIQEVSLWNPRR